jgi:hypothetical protein
MMVFRHYVGIFRVNFAIVVFGIGRQLPENKLNYHYFGL